VNKQIPRYDPPAVTLTAGNNLFAAVRTLERAVLALHQYLYDWLTLVADQINTGYQGFARQSVAAAATVSVSARQTLVTGTATIQTINAPPGFSGQIVLISQDGFSTGTLGNIAAAKTVPAGQAILLEYFPPTAKWYPVLGA
jgi:hypothetical protein